MTESEWNLNGYLALVCTCVCPADGANHTRDARPARKTLPYPGFAGAYLLEY